MGQHVTLDLVNISRAAIGEALVRCGVEIASKSFCDNASLTIAARQALIRETFYGLDKANPQAPGHLARVYESSLGVS
ncbi:MAG: hypothetical protein L6Q71_05025, partial [Planctomycetes bacterium]|nr:hypothetical protein [Planctomycetota bacterium]